MIKLPDYIQSKIQNFHPDEEILPEKHRTGDTIVFTNGCFDILHLGHLHLLISAKELGSMLIVGLNTDASVRRLKGPSRPIQDQDTRAVLLASLEFVDKVVLFSDNTPEALIQNIKPDVLVKGGDYSIASIVGYDIVSSYGGKVITIPLLEGHSSSLIIDKSKKV